MILIDGKEPDMEFVEDILSYYPKVVTVTASNVGSIRRTTNGKVMYPKQGTRVSAIYSVKNPDKGGRPMQVAYSPTNTLSFDEATGRLSSKQKELHTYALPAKSLEINKEEDSELVLFLALMPENSDNILTKKAKKPIVGAKPLFGMPTKDAAQAGVNKGKQLFAALAYLHGDKKITDRKAYDTYKHLIGYEDALITNENIDGVFLKLEEQAKANPEAFIALIENSNHTVLAYITTAFEKGILITDDKRKIFYGASVEGVEHKKAICTYKADEDKVSRMLDYLLRSDVDSRVKQTVLYELEKANEKAPVQNEQ